MIGLGKGGRKFTNDDMDRQEEQYPWNNVQETGRAKQTYTHQQARKTRKMFLETNLFLLDHTLKVAGYKQFHITLRIQVLVMPAQSIECRN